MCGHYQIAAPLLKLHIEDRSRGESAFESGPVIAVVRGVEQSRFGTEYEQPTMIWVFPNYMRRLIQGKITVDRGPGLAEIVRLINVGTIVVEFMKIYGDICRTGGRRRSFDLANAAPLRQRLDVAGYVGPMLPPILRDLNVA